MSKTFNFYCDESTHLQNDGMPYMMIGYISSAYNQLKQHKEHLKWLKAKHKVKGETKWTSVSASQYPYFADLLDYFFATDLAFRSVQLRSVFSKKDFSLKEKTVTFKN
jgi:hypothetical protein